MTTQPLTHLRNGCFESHNSFMSQQLCTPRCSALRFQSMPKKMLPDPGFFEVVVTIYPLTPRQDSFGNHSSCGLDRVFGHQVASRNEKMPTKKTTKNCQKSCRSARSFGREMASVNHASQCPSYYKSCENPTRTFGIAALMLREFDAIADIR